MAEHGPWRPLKDGATLARNAYSWNRVANMLYVEQPVTVGFSYTTEDLDNKAAFGDDQAALDNYRVIQTFLARFSHLRLHDLYLSGESYGGHYLPSLARLILNKNQEAAVAAAPPAAPPAALPPSPPSKDQAQAAALPPSLPPPKIKLRGFLVGNPSTDPVLQLIGQVDTLHSRHLLPPSLYERWTTLCASTPTVAHLGSTACVQVQRQVLEAVKEYDVYSISTPPCPLLAAGEEEANISSSSSSSSARRRKSTTAPAVAPAEKKKGGRGGGGGGGGGFYLLGNDKLWAGLLRLDRGNSTAAATPATVGGSNSSTAPSPLHHHRYLRSSSPSPSPTPPTPPSLLPSFPTSPPLPYESCQALYGATYLNRLDVKTAIHASEWVSWEDCSSLVLDNYQRSDWSLFLEPLFKSLVEKEGEAGREGGGQGLRVLLYSGEDDTVCSSKGTEMWLETLGWATVKEWAPWSVREGGTEGGKKGKGKVGKAAVPVVAGMKKKYENGVVFATVNGAGHAVPSFKPREALQLFMDFLEGRL